MFTRDLEEQTEMNNTLEGINNRITGRRAKWPWGQNGGNHCCRTEYTKICIIGVPGGEEREKWPKKIFDKIIAEKFPNMGREIVNQVQEAQWVPGRINPRRNTPRHIVMKLTKIKDKNKVLKTTKSNREKRQITYKGIPISLSADFSTETLQARRQWLDIFKVMKWKNLQPRILYPARLSFRFEKSKAFQTSKS